MANCIIHIGMHKTGTTSIQNSLHNFSDEKFVYANLGNVSNHSLAIYSLFSEHPERHHLHVHRSSRDSASNGHLQKYIEAIHSDLDEAINNAGDRTVIISGEDIGILPYDALVRMHDYIKHRVNDLTIVAYIRPPGGFINSAFQQRVKGGSLKDFNLDGTYRSYKKSFSKFDEIFGDDNVKLWMFKPNKFPNGCVVQDFCFRLNIDFPVNNIVRFNESPSRQVVGLIYIYRKYGNTYGAGDMRGDEAHVLSDMLSTIGNDRFRFSPDLIRPVLERNRDDIAWMEQRLGESLLEELGEYKEGDIRDEMDLLYHSRETIIKLLDKLGSRAPVGVTGKNPTEIAQLIHALRGKVIV